nr:hypothetical protein [Tanacetum cinerariifolium]
VFVPQKALSREELHFSNNSKTADVSKSFLIPNEDLSDDTTPSVARKFLNEEAAKFVGDFKSLAYEVDASLAKHKALELEIERLFKAVVSQDIMIILQNESVVDTSDLQTELERTKELFENCIIKKETEYAKLWNDWYKKCDECKYDKISYDKAYKDMQQKIERLQAQLGDLKGKSKDTSCVSDTRNMLSQKLENKNVELEFQTNALSNPVTSNLVSTPQESKSVNNDKVIAPGMFRYNPSKTSREAKHVPNTVRARARTKPITVSQPSVITKKDVNSDLNGLSSTGIDNTKTRRPQPRSNTKNDRVLSASKSSRSQNKEAEVEEHHRNLLLFKNNKHISSACNNIKIDYQNVISKVVCAMCKKCLISVNHDKCLSNYVNGKNSCGKNQKAKVSVKEIQKKYQPKVSKPKKVGTCESLATPKPKKPRFLLRWSPTSRLFDQKGKLVDSSELKSKSNGGNLKLLINFVWKFMGTVRFRNDHVAAILGFGDLQNLEGVNLLKGDRSTNLYTINLHEMAYASPICLMARASSTKSWLWNQRLSHLNFDTINDLGRNDLRLHLLHMDLCGPMRIASINGKRYVLVIVDDYTRYTWVHFPRSKDEALEMIIKFLKKITVLLQSSVIIIKTDNGTEFKNQVLKEYFDTVGISHQMSSVRTPQQNRVAERRNRTLVEAARTMLIFLVRRYSYGLRQLLLLVSLKTAPLFINDREDIGKLGAKGDIDFFIGYSADSCAYRVYNRRTKKIMETMNVSFDELLAMAFEQRSSKPGLNSELDLLFEVMYDDYICGQPSTTARTVLPAQEPQVCQSSTASTTIADIAPIPTNSFSHATNILITSQDVDELNPNVMVDGNTFANPFANPSTCSSGLRRFFLYAMLFVHSIYVMYCPYIRSLSVMLSRISFHVVYRSYPKNNREGIGKLGTKGDIGFFIGYSADSCAYRVYNRRTKKIMETINVSFDELSAMAFEQNSSKPRLQSMTSGQISSVLDLTYAPSTITTQQPSEGELDLLFEVMYDDYIGGQPLATARTVPPAQEPQVRQ